MVSPGISGNFVPVIENPIKVERQEHNRFRFWGEIKELGGRVLRVVTLDDKKTIHNAFPGRGKFGRHNTKLLTIK